VKDSYYTHNPLWTKKDEKNHRPSIIEWWCMEGFYRTIENNKRYSFKTTFTEWLEQRPKRIGSFYINSFFDLDTDQSYHTHWRDDSKQLESAKDHFEIKINQCLLKGSYPTYETILFNDKNNVQLNLQLKATAYPRFIAQDITGGHLPMGLGTYRYGFIPNGILSGLMIHNNNSYTIDGQGYYEHVWGDFSYINPFKGNIKQTFATYAKLITWRLQNATPTLPKTVSLSTENNPFGYDWVWGVFDNGWSFFFGNVMLWLTQGPVFGTFILTKDGKTYQEFSKISFHYNKIRYSAHFDLYYPTEFSIKAETSKESIELSFQMTNSPIEYINRFKEDNFYRGFVIIEAPGVATGFLNKNGEKTSLQGICKIEPQRQISAIGHNQISLSVIKPPHGFGLKLSLESHLLKKHLISDIKFTPLPNLSFSLKKIDDSKIHKN
jgi:hypothetical protein